VGRTVAVLLREWIFLHVMFGCGRGVVGPKELMGLVGSVTDYRVYSHLTPRSVEVEVYCNPYPKWDFEITELQHFNYFWWDWEGP
jgi:hypothetical protein